MLLLSRFPWGTKVSSLEPALLTSVLTLPPLRYTFTSPQSSYLPVSSTCFDPFAKMQSLCPGRVLQPSPVPHPQTNSKILGPESRRQSGSPLPFPLKNLLYWRRIFNPREPFVPKPAADDQGPSLSTGPSYPRRQALALPPYRSGGLIRCIFSIFTHACSVVPRGGRMLQVYQSRAPSS